VLRWPAEARVSCLFSTASSREASQFVYGANREALEATNVTLDPADQTYGRPTIDVAWPGRHGDWRPYFERAKQRPAGRRRKRATRHNV